MFTRSLTHLIFYEIEGYNSLGPTSANDCPGSRSEQLSIVWACSFFACGIAVVIEPPISGLLHKIDSKSAQAASVWDGGRGGGRLVSIGSVLMAMTKRKLHV